MLVVQWPSLYHHIPFIVVVQLCWPALFSLEPSLKLQTRLVYSCASKCLICFGKKRGTEVHDSSLQFPNAGVFVLSKSVRLYISVLVHIFRI